MASYTMATGDKAAHHSLVAATVDTVTMANDFDQVEVLNRDGAAEIYFTVDGSAPTVGGANCQVLPACIGAAICGVASSGNTVVRLISAGTPAYSVSTTS